MNKINQFGMAKTNTFLWILPWDDETEDMFSSILHLVFIVLWRSSRSPAICFTDVVKRQNLACFVNDCFLTFHSFSNASTRFSGIHFNAFSSESKSYFGLLSLILAHSSSLSLFVNLIISKTDKSWETYQYSTTCSFD